MSTGQILFCMIMGLVTGIVVLETWKPVWSIPIAVVVFIVVAYTIRKANTRGERYER